MDFNEDIENEELELRQCADEDVAFNLERVAECATYWREHDSDHITFRYKEDARYKLLLAVVDLLNAGWKPKGMNASDEARAKRIREAPIRINEKPAEVYCGELKGCKTEVDLMKGEKG